MVVTISGAQTARLGDLIRNGGGGPKSIVIVTTASKIVTISYTMVTWRLKESFEDSLV